MIKVMNTIIHHLRRKDNERLVKMKVVQAMSKPRAHGIELADVTRQIQIMSKVVKEVLARDNPFTGSDINK